MDILASFFNYISSFVTQDACDQNRTYFIGHTGKYFRQSYFFVKFRICKHGMSRALEEHIMAELSDHVESCSSTAKYLHFGNTYGHQT